VGPQGQRAPGRTDGEGARPRALTTMPGQACRNQEFRTKSSRLKWPADPVQNIGSDGRCPCGAGAKREAPRTG